MGALGRCLTPRKSYFRLDLGSLLSALKHASGRRFEVRTPTGFVVLTAVLPVVE